MAVPPLARSERSGWCCLRCLTRRGISMGSGPLFRARGVLGASRCVTGRRGGRGALGAGGLADALRGRDLAGRGGERARGGDVGPAGGLGSLDRGRLGCRTPGLCPAGRGTGGAGATRTLLALSTLLARGKGLEGLALGTRAAHVALVDPHLDADAAEGGPGLVQAVVDVRAERVQRYPALAVELRPAHLRAAETAGALRPDALDLRAALSRLHGLAHGATEAHAAGELLGDGLGDQLGVVLGVLDLEDVERHLLAGELLQLPADALGLRPAAADDDPRPGGVDVDADPVTGALDLHLGDPGPLHALAHELADGHVFLDVVLVQLVGVPPGLVVGGDTESEPVRVDLLTH